MSYCAKCGNTGEKVDGTPCDCQVTVDSIYSNTTCLLLPEQYRGIVFNKFLIKSDLGEVYQNYMHNIHDEVCSGRWKYKNELICSPAGHSKTILAYCCIQQMFRRGMRSCALYNVDEADVFSDDVKEAEVLFVRIPLTSDSNTFNKIATLLDIRVRRGKSTIFLYNGSYEQLTHNDNYFTMRSIVGDGSYATVKNSSWKIKV